MRTFAPLVLAFLPSGCAQLQSHADTIKEAVGDLDIKGIAQDHACGIYIANGRDQAEQIYANEWPKFEPVFNSPPDPAEDLRWCQGELLGLGAHVAFKLRQDSSTSLCGAVMFGADFNERSVAEQASICMHELAHIYEQKRVGCEPGNLAWIKRYATVSGRMVSEGTAYALKDAAMERYGVPRESVEKSARSRARRFPRRYMLSHLVAPKCSEDYFLTLRRVLRERSGF